LVGEILPAKGVSFSVSFEWISSSIVSLGYIYVANSLGKHMTFYIFALINLSVFFKLLIAKRHVYLHIILLRKPKGTQNSKTVYYTPLEHII